MKPPIQILKRIHELKLIESAITISEQVYQSFLDTNDLREMRGEKSGILSKEYMFKYKMDIIELKRLQGDIEHWINNKEK